MLSFLAFLPAVCLIHIQDHVQFHQLSASACPLMPAEEPEHIVLGILLGSREQEVRRMGPIVLQALDALPSLLGQGKRCSGVTLVLPTLAHLEPLVREFQWRARVDKGVEAVVVSQRSGKGTQGGPWDAYAVRWPG